LGEGLCLHWNEGSPWVGMKQQLSLSIIRCFFHQNFNNKGIIPILLRKKEYYYSEQSEIEEDQ
jgi:hypothetical protein